MIKEAERRNLNIDNLNCGTVKNIPDGWLYKPQDNSLYLIEKGKTGYAFHNGKWAEILPNEEETIDWSKAGQLVELKSQENKVVMLTTGAYNIDANCFSAIVVQGNKLFRFGEYSKHWGMYDFKPFKGELTLKNE